MRQMMRFIAGAVSLAVISMSPAVGRSPLGDAQIKQAIIKQSIAEYPGNCPCPYNSARNGSSCGGRSAWSRGGGYAPMCFPKDVSAAQVRAYRENH
jgi:hypothetical protein